MQEEGAGCSNSVARWQKRKHRCGEFNRIGVCYANLGAIVLKGYLRRFFTARFGAGDGINQPIGRGSLH